MAGNTGIDVNASDRKIEASKSSPRRGGSRDPLFREKKRRR
jgi:hypothetical protein